MEIIAAYTDTHTKPMNKNCIITDFNADGIYSYHSALNGQGASKTGRIQNSRIYLLLVTILSLSLYFLHDFGSLKICCLSYLEHFFVQFVLNDLVRVIFVV
jgi:hypothetical protein